MAIKTNTTKTIGRASTVLAKKCEATQKNLKQLCARAGCSAEEKIVTVSLPILPGSNDDVIFCGLNGVDFYFLRGTDAKMPECVKQLLKDCGQL